MWLFVAISGYTLLAVVFILDKLIVSKSEVKPVIYTFYSTIFLFGSLVIFPFVGFGWLRGLDWWWAVVSGVAFGFGMWTMFLAVKKGEATHISPFNGAMVTIFIYLLANFFLGEKLTQLQMGGMFILFFSSVLLSFEKSKEHNGFHTGFLWAIISGLFFALSHVSAKYLYGIYPFWIGFVWTRATSGLVGIFLLIFSSVRKSFQKKKKDDSAIYARRHAGLIIVANKILSVAAVVLIQYAMAIGSVTIVGALSGLQYVLMFLLVYLLTKFLPKVFSEYFTKQEIAVEIIAFILVVIGSAFFIL